MMETLCRLPGLHIHDESGGRDGLHHQRKAERHSAADLSGREDRFDSAVARMPMFEALQQYSGINLYGKDAKSWPPQLNSAYPRGEKLERRKKSSTKYSRKRSNPI